MASISDGVDNLLMSLPLDGICPTFTGLTMKQGWVAAYCADAETAGWLKQSVPTVNGDLKAIDETQLPRASIFYLYLPNCQKEDVAKISRRLIIQNLSLRNEDWKIVSKKDREKGLTQLTVSVSHSRAKEFTGPKLKLSWMFGYVYLRPRRQAKRQTVQSGSLRDVSPEAPKASETQKSPQTTPKIPLTLSTTSSISKPILPSTSKTTTSTSTWPKNKYAAKTTSPGKVHKQHGHTPKTGKK